MPEYPYNFGLALGGPGGVIEKDTLRMMVRSDKLLYGLGRALHTNKPPAMILQLTDTWITDFKRSDDIVDGTGSKKEHSVVATLVVATNYKFDQINPTAVVAYDPTYKGALFVPFVDWLFGDHWRLHTELQFYFPMGTQTDPVTGNGALDTHGFGTLANQNQANVRLTYQF